MKIFKLLDLKVGKMYEYKCPIWSEIELIGLGRRWRGKRNEPAIYEHEHVLKPISAFNPQYSFLFCPY